MVYCNLKMFTFQIEFCENHFERNLLKVIILRARYQIEILKYTIMKFVSSLRQMQIFYTDKVSNASNGTYYNDIQLIFYDVLFLVILSNSIREHLIINT